MKTTIEKNAIKINGFAALIVVFVMFVTGILSIVKTAEPATMAFIPGFIPAMPIVWSVCLIVLAVISFSGFFTVQPNESKVLIFWGSYIGSAQDAGFCWANPFASKRSISLRMRNFNSEKLKVNDLNGNPIEIAAVITWKVIDSARAVFNVDKFEQFVNIQSETAIRILSSHYPYDTTEEDKISLRGNSDNVAQKLKDEIDLRVKEAGIEIIDARISHLAYAPEIAQAMLRRQQAQAVIAARKQIVEGAVGMVEMALKHLADNKIVELDSERKAAMVNNLLVALVSESQAQPVINAGTLY